LQRKASHDSCHIHNVSYRRICAVNLDQDVGCVRSDDSQYDDCEDAGDESYRPSRLVLVGSSADRYRHIYLPIVYIIPGSERMPIPTWLVKKIKAVRVMPNFSRHSDPPQCRKQCRGSLQEEGSGPMWPSDRPNQCVHYVLRSTRCRDGLSCSHQSTLIL
jgi:hypothetical protein